MGGNHTPSIAFRYLPPKLKEGCREPVLGVWGGGGGGGGAIHLSPCCGWTGDELSY